MRESKKLELLNALKAYWAEVFNLPQSIYCMNLCLDIMTLKELQAETTTVFGGA